MVDADVAIAEVDQAVVAAPVRVAAPGCRLGERRHRRILERRPHRGVSRLHRRVRDRERQRRGEVAGRRAVTTTVKVTNLLNQTVQQHIFGDLLRRTVVGEVKFKF